MNAEQVEAFLEHNEEDARDLLHEHIPSAARRFEKAVRELNKLMVEVQKEFPDANYYLAMDALNLMLGPSHTQDGRMRPNQYFTAECVPMPSSGGGDW